MVAEQFGKHMPSWSGENGNASGEVGPYNGGSSSRKPRWHRGALGGTKFMPYATLITSCPSGYLPHTSLFGVPSYIGEPDLVSKKVQWLLKPGGTAVLMYNRRTPEETELYWRLDMEIPPAYGRPVDDEFWRVEEGDDPDWLTIIGSKR